MDQLSDSVGSKRELGLLRCYTLEGLGTKNSQARTESQTKVGNTGTYQIKPKCHSFTGADQISPPHSQREEGWGASAPKLNHKPELHFVL